MASLVRKLGSGHFREEPFENLAALAVRNDRTDLRADVSRVLSSMSEFDRSVAADLVEYSPIEIGQRLGVSRATVYRAIGRLRVAFMKLAYPPGARRMSATRSVTADE